VTVAVGVGVELLESVAEVEAEGLIVTGRVARAASATGEHETPEGSRFTVKERAVRLRVAAVVGVTTSVIDGRASGSPLGMGSVLTGPVAVAVEVGVVAVPASGVVVQMISPLSEAALASMLDGATRVGAVVGVPTPHATVYGACTVAASVGPVSVIGKV
jgi:hypothetical protein